MIYTPVELADIYMGRRKAIHISQLQTRSELARLVNKLHTRGVDLELISQLFNIPILILGVILLQEEYDLLKAIPKKR